MIMELLGNSLETYFQLCGKRFSLKTVCMLGIQMVKRIEWVHYKNIVHRDIKPDNFVMGLNNKKHLVYILDFGLSKKYYSTHSGKHIKFIINKKLTGTARYASVNALRGGEQSRKDDLEAIGYVLMYFLRGELPWQGLHINKYGDKYKFIYEKKKSTTPEELCKGYPNEFAEYITYTKNLSFEAKPDYDYLVGLLKNVLRKNKMEYDYHFDWMKEKPIIIEEPVKEKEIHGELSNGEVDLGEGRFPTERNFNNDNINSKQVNNNKNGTSNQKKVNKHIENKEWDRNDSSCVLF